MKVWKWILALVLVPALLSAQGLPVKSGTTSDLADVNVNKALSVTPGKAATATYIISVANQAYAVEESLINLEAEAARGFRISQICINPGTAAAAAVVRWQLIRTTTASSGGTVISQEATSGNATMSRMDPADGNWSGAARTGGTEGTSGAILDMGMLFTNITATPPTTFPVWCKSYGQNGEKMPTIVSGTSNGVKLMFEGTGTPVDQGASIVFIAN